MRHQSKYHILCWIGIHFIVVGTVNLSRTLSSIPHSLDIWPLLPHSFLSTRCLSTSDVSGYFITTVIRENINDSFLEKKSPFQRRKYSRRVANTRLVPNSVTIPHVPIARRPPLYVEVLQARGETKYIHLLLDEVDRR